MFEKPSLSTGALREASGLFKTNHCPQVPRARHLWTIVFSYVCLKNTHCQQVFRAGHLDCSKQIFVHRCLARGTCGQLSFRTMMLQRGTYCKIHDVMMCKLGSRWIGIWNGWGPFRMIVLKGVGEQFSRNLQRFFLLQIIILQVYYFGHARPACEEGFVESNTITDGWYCAIF